MSTWQERSREYWVDRAEKRERLQEMERDLFGKPASDEDKKETEEERKSRWKFCKSCGDIKHCTKELRDDCQKIHPKQGRVK